MELSPIRLLRSDLSVWLVYAGPGRRFLEEFEAQSRVFLTIPGFNATENVLQSTRLMKQHLAMSEAISDYIYQRRQNTPNRNSSSYSPQPHTAGTPEARAFAAELGNIQRLFVDAKVGDLVFSPREGTYSPFLIGEITRSWSKLDDIALDKLNGEIVPTRRVKWLNLALTRRDFPIRTAKRLYNRHAVTAIDDIYYQDILEKVYPSYVWRESSKLDLFGDEYRGKDPLQPFLAAKTLKYVMASVFAFETQQIDAFQALSVEDAINQFYDESLVIDLYQNFNSPGKFTVISSVASLTTLLTAGILLATKPSDGNFGQQKAQVEQSVSEKLEGTGKPAARQVLNGYLDSLDARPWKPVQRDLGSPAKDRLGLNLSNSVEVRQSRSRLSGN